MNLRHRSEQLNETTIRVMVVDDHLLVGEMIVRSLATHPDFDVIAVAEVDEALALIENNERFDIVLLDYDIPGEDGVDLLKRFLSANAGGVVLFSGVAKRSVVDRALELGAVGFIPKTTPLKALQHAISLIASGECYVPVDHMRGNSNPEASLELKPIEASVATRLCAGLTNKAIARELDLTEVLVKMHVRTLFAKLGVSNRTQAVLAYQKLGFLD